MTNSLGQVDTLSVELWLQDNEVLVQWGARPQVESVSSTLLKFAETGFPTKVVAAATLSPRLLSSSLSPLEISNAACLCPLPAALVSLSL